VYPILEFDDDDIATECLKEWQDRLYLNDWIISFNPHVLPDDDTDYYGQAVLNYVNKTATINIIKPTMKFKCKLTKFCAEHCLVHELLHLKYDMPEDKEFLSLYFEHEQHMLLEQMSRSLIMVKYNLSRSWFDNVNI
jgi:hypothetical protein